MSVYRAHFIVYTEIVRACTLVCLVVDYLISFYGTAPKQLNWLDSKFIIATTSQPFNGFSRNFQGILLRMPYCTLFV